MQTVRLLSRSPLAGHLLLERRQEGVDVLLRGVEGAHPAHHAGRLVMSSPDGLEVFLEDHWAKLSEATPSDPRISMDGRYLAWFEGDALAMYDFDAGARVARAVLP